MPGTFLTPQACGVWSLPFPLVIPLFIRKFFRDATHFLFALSEHVCGGSESRDGSFADEEWGDDQREW